MNKRHGLGRGLGALIRDENNLQTMVGEQQIGEKVLQLNVQEIVPNPYQPRKDFNEEELQSLAQSIREQGLLQPIVVRFKDGRYELVAGERRLRAAKIAGLTEISALQRQYSDADSMNFALLENLQRQDLNPMEVASAYSVLMKEGGMTQEELSQKLGISRSKIANSVRLLSLPQEVQDYVRQGQLQESAARLLAGLPKMELMTELAQKAVLEGQSVKLLEQEINRVKSKIMKESTTVQPPVVQPQEGEPVPKGQPENQAEQVTVQEERHGEQPQGQEQPAEHVNGDVARFMEYLEHRCGEKVEIVPVPGSNAKVLGFKFVTNEDLNRIYEMLSSLLRGSRQQDRFAGAEGVKFSV